MKAKRVLLISGRVLGVLVAFAAFGCVYINVFRPWHVNRMARKLFEEYRSSPSPEIGQRLADVLDTGLVEREEEILRAILKPEIEAPRAFRRDERVIVKLREPGLAFRRRHLWVMPQRSADEDGLARARGGFYRLDLTSLATRDRSDNPPTVPGHYSTDLNVAYELFHEDREGIFQKWAYKLGIKTRLKVGVSGTIVNLPLHVEFDVVEPCEGKGKK